MKKIQKILTGGLAALCLSTSLLTTTACSDGKQLGRDYYIHAGEVYVYVDGFSARISEKVNYGLTFDSQMFVTEVYTDASDVDRNFMCMSSKFTIHDTYIKESYAKNFSDVKTLKMDYITLYMGYDEFIIYKEFTFEDILAEQPISETERPKEWTYEGNMHCALADYPLNYWGACVYSDGEFVYVTLEEPKEYYQVIDEECQTLFLEKCFKGEF